MADGCIIFDAAVLLYIYLMKYKQIKHRVSHQGPAMLIADYCAQFMPSLGSKSAAKKALRSGQLLLNGNIAKTSDRIKHGDLVLLRLKIKAPKVFNMQIPITYEDEHFMVVDKPGGIAVNGNRYKTVENVFARHPMPNHISGVLERPIALHRLDVPTKGLLMLAKTKEAQIALSGLFERREIKKMYRAVVHGKSDRQGTIDFSINGKTAMTKYQTVRTVQSRIYGYLSLIHAFPVSGRTHQIRKHLHGINHLIVGDKEYAGTAKTVLGKGLFLQASELAFEHPFEHTTIKLTLSIPGKFTRLLDREEERFRQ